MVMGFAQPMLRATLANAPARVSRFPATLKPVRSPEQFGAISNVFPVFGPRRVRNQNTRRARRAGRRGDCRDGSKGFCGSQASRHAGSVGHTVGPPALAGRLGHMPEKQCARSTAAVCHLLSKRPVSFVPRCRRHRSMRRGRLCAGTFPRAIGAAACHQAAPVEAGVSQVS